MARKDRTHKVANLDRWKADHGRRGSSAASPHTPKPRKGARGARKREAILAAY